MKPATLQSIFDVFIKTRDKIGTPQSGATSSPSPGPSAADKSQAEKFKQEGNAQISSKNYDAAIESYTKAIALDPKNPVYYSNRAAAYSSKGDHLSAIGDAEQGISVDPNFIKAYHRLGYLQHPDSIQSPQLTVFLVTHNTPLKTSVRQPMLLNAASNLNPRTQP